MYHVWEAFYGHWKPQHSSQSTFWYVTSAHIILILKWVASREKVPNDLNRCHIGHPSLDMTQTF